MFAHNPGFFADFFLLDFFLVAFFRGFLLGHGTSVSLKCSPVCRRRQATLAAAFAQPRRGAQARRVLRLNLLHEIATSAQQHEEPVDAEQMTLADRDECASVLEIFSDRRRHPGQVAGDHERTVQRRLVVNLTGGTRDGFGRLVVIAARSSATECSLNRAFKLQPPSA